MSFLEKIARICTARVAKYGAPYFIFALFGVINYPLTYFIRASMVEVPIDDLVMRAIAFLLSAVLLLRKFWPQKLRKYLALYWYIMVTLVVPTLATYLLLQNTHSLWWLMNYATAPLIFIMILDCISFLILFSVGASLGILLFMLKNGPIIWHSSWDSTQIAIYMFFIVFIISAAFTRNKEIFAATVLNSKDMLNHILEEEVKLRTASLNEALRIKEEFLQNINHEIRTPVQVISGISSLLLDNYNKLSDLKKQEMLVQLNKSSQRLFKLVTNVLDLLRFKQGKMILEKKHWQMTEIVKNAVDEMQFLADQKHILIEVQNNASKEAEVYIDKDKIIQVIINLLSNSIKYSQERTKIVISVSEKKQLDHNGILSDFLVVSVSDNGVGIPEKELVSIFQSFTQSTRTNNKAGGSGLGLAIVAEIICSHNGVINVKNNKKGGCTFYFSIPYLRTKALKLVKKDKKKVLFVDDEQGCCVVGSMILESEGFNVHSVNSGSAAMEYLERNYQDIDIVFLDVMMPGMNGLQCLENIQDNDNYKSIPIIMQTGIGNEIELKKAVSLGAKDCIAKPYVKERLVEVMS